jgi:hypothetical protein
VRRLRECDCPFRSEALPAVPEAGEEALHRQSNDLADEMPDPGLDDCLAKAEIIK